MEKKKNICRSIVGKPAGKIQFRTITHRMNDKVNM
jgi:hypothetical protein